MVRVFRYKNAMIHSQSNLKTQQCQIRNQIVLIFRALYFLLSHPAAPRQPIPTVARPQLYPQRQTPHDHFLFSGVNGMPPSYQEVVMYPPTSPPQYYAAGGIQVRLSDQIINFYVCNTGTIRCVKFSTIYEICPAGTLLKNY